MRPVSGFASSFFGSRKRSFGMMHKPAMTLTPDSPLARRVAPSPNHGERRGAQPDMLLLHYTGMASGAAALARLRDPLSEVSAHYLVFEDGGIVQMVPEARRAWHAGRGAWKGVTDLNAAPFAPAGGYVAGYWAMDGEIALHSWQLRLPRSVVYCLPVLAEDTTLRFAPWRPGDALVTNRFGIPEPDVAAASALEPQAMSLVVMPLVGFDGAGQRLGMGGGWYDRSFAFRNTAMPPPWLVGVGFDAQRVERLAAEDWDVLPDAICTETLTLQAEPHEHIPHE